MTQSTLLTIDQGSNPLLARRIAAIAYDTIIIAGLVLLVTGLVVIPTGMVVGQEQWAGLQHAFWVKTTLRIANLAVILGFHVGFWSHGGQTLGMRAWRLRVVKNDGTTLGPTDALKRYVAAWCSAIPFGLGFLSSLWDPQRLAWHDRVSQTRLILIPMNSD